MRWVTAVLGLLAGLVAGVALLAWSPAARLDPRFELPGDELVQLSVAETLTRGLPAGPWPLLGIGDDPPDNFVAPALKHVRASVVVLKPDSGGANALAVKLSAVSPRNNLLRGRLFTNSVWSLAWPGHGSLFLVGSDDHWPMLEDAVWSGLSGEGFRPGYDSYSLTDRLQLGRFHGVVGATGALAEFAGRYREWVSLGGDAPTGYLAVEPRTR